jgi:hypothetical protein
MADIDLKTETPDATLPSTGFLFGADSQAAASPSVYSTQAVATTLLGSTTISGATITADAPVLDLAQTWNNAAVTFTGAKLNVTDTASNAASLLIDLQVGGSRRFQVTKGGVLFIGQGAGAGQIGSGGGGTISIANSFSLNGSGQMSAAGAAGQVSFGASLSVQDVFLGRRGAGNWRLGAADAGTVSATVTITIAAPGVVTWANHLLSTGTPVFFTTTGALPTGITAGTTYFAVVTGINTFQLAASFADAVAATPTVITTSGTQSGTHTGNRNAVAQAVNAQSVTGVTDRPGANLTIAGSQGTGTGAGGSIVFQVAPAGSSGTAQNALATALEINSARDSIFSGNVGLYSGTALRIGSSSVNWQVVATTTYVGQSSNNFFGFYNGTNLAAGGSFDVTLYRDTADTLALRRGTNRQNSRVYATYTDASNGSWIEINTNLYGADQAGIVKKANGTGTSVTPDLYVGSDVSGGGIVFRTGNTSTWRFSSAGNFLAQTDNAYDIGASGATRPRDLFLGRNLVQVGAYHEMAEMTAPAAPAANSVRIYAVDNGSGKTQLMALFATGAAQQIAIEP